MTYPPTPKIIWVARGARQRVRILHHSAMEVMRGSCGNGRILGVETLKGEAARAEDKSAKSRRTTRMGSREGSGGSMEGIIVVLFASNKSTSTGKPRRPTTRSFRQEGEIRRWLELSSGESKVDRENKP
jgi:hypothetical protein